MTDPNTESYGKETSDKVGPGDDVLTRDISSGTIHRRIRVGDNLATVNGATRQTYIAMCAFMARRLQYHVPRLVGSMN